MKTVTLAVAALIVMTSCTSPGPQPPEPARDPKPAAVRCCVMQDLSGSIQGTRTPTITEPELRALLDFIAARSGDLGFGIIQERSDRTLVRVVASEPPPPAPPEPHNPLYRPKWQQQRAEAERARQAWEAERKTREEAFLQEVKARLKAPLSRSTDVCGAVRRCNLMLAEPTSSATIKFFILVSDGQHNIKRELCPEALAGDIRLLLVNGSGVQGILKRYKPVRFESFTAAIRYIQENGGQLR